MQERFKVFVDGEEGTTGLEINERLAGRMEVEKLKIDPDKRKDPAERKRLLNAADIAFLCLPDTAAKESAALVDNPGTCIIDASTAHRIDPAWAYGIPELNKTARDTIKKSKRITVPGCHATGFIMSLYPLIEAGLVSPNYPVTCLSISGYSGGGKKLIAAHEGPDADKKKLSSPRMYSLALNHKHLPEMQMRTGLTQMPVFSPMVGDYYKGMVVSIPLFAQMLKKKAEAKDIREILAAHYAGEKFVRVMPYEADPVLDGGFLDAQACNGTNRIDIFVFGSQERIMLSARLDNLGKGASGAAVQCMNLVMGLDEATGLSA